MCKAYYYEIVIKGHLDSRWARQFAGLALIPLPSGETLLAGTLPDQAALHGVLTHIRNLGLTLIRVEQKDERTQRESI